MKRYMHPNPQVLKQVYKELKKEKWTLKMISETIGCDFRNALYKGRGLKESSFFMLENLVGYVIPTTFAEKNLEQKYDWLSDKPIVMISAQKNKRIKELIAQD
ncbi:MAG: hypothetical protein ACXAC7_06275 [Candidatus Hodarchaeales archaeon]|jgi:hypothetical protein